MRWPFRRRPAGTSAPNGIAMAIATLCRDPTDAHRAALYRALGTGELFLAVAVAGAVHASPPSGLEQGRTLPVLTTTAPDGKPALLAFTSLEQLHRRLPDAPGHARLPSLEALDIVLDQALDGLVLDPDGPWAVVPREDVVRIRLASSPACIE
jgi:hypothetical protein